LIDERLHGTAAVNLHSLAREARKPCVVKPTAAHRVVSVVVTRGPVHELDVISVHDATGCERFRSETLQFTLSEPAESKLRRGQEEYDELKMRDECIAPACKRTGKHPAGGSLELRLEEANSLVLGTESLIGRISRLPQVVVRLEVREVFADG
jgi:hypothetical protein